MLRSGYALSSVRTLPRGLASVIIWGICLTLLHVGIRSVDHVSGRIQRNDLTDEDCHRKVLSRLPQPDRTDVVLVRERALVLVDHDALILRHELPPGVFGLWLGYLLWSGHFYEGDGGSVEPDPSGGWRVTLRRGTESEVVVVPR